MFFVFSCDKELSGANKVPLYWDTSTLISSYLWSGPNLAHRAAMLDRIAGQLERYMDLLSARQKLVASNIANADTPGYRSRDINFQAEFQSAAGGGPRSVEVAGLPVKND